MRIRFVLIGVMLQSLLLAQTDTSVAELKLNEVVVTDLLTSSLATSGLSLSVIRRPADQSLQGAADIISRVPGMFVDASVGEAFTRVYSRGVSLSAEDDIGWFYISLQEDGLPVTLGQYQQFAPDFFVRSHLGMSKVEVLRGGKSSILAPNSPGGVVNFITTPRMVDSPLHMRLTGGMYDGGRAYGRIEGHASDMIEPLGIALDGSFMYRYDQGPRRVDYSMNNGALLKVGASKTLKNGLISFSLKSLSDRVNRYTGVPATNWNDPEPAFGFSFQQSTTLPPPILGQSEFNPANGIGANELAGRVDIDLQLGQWRLTNKMKYSSKSLNWNTAIGGQPIGLDNFIAYFISGDPFPAGIIDINGGEVVVDNSGAFAVFQGLEPSFDYISGRLPNDAVMGTGLWQKDDQIKDFMNELKVYRVFENIETSSGLFFGRGNTTIGTNASFYYTTYEEQSRPLEVKLINPGEAPRQLSTQAGVSNIDGLFYEGADINISHISLFTDWRLLLTDAIKFDLGLRWENIGHHGSKDRFAPDTRTGGIDGDPLSSFDNNPLVAYGQDEFDFRYAYLSYSLAMHLDLSDRTALFTRHSLGRKAPELNYYVNNFSNQAVNEPGRVQDVWQTELGIKYRATNGALAATLFRSELKNVGFVDFVFDDQTNQIFYTPTLFNETSTNGIELEAEYQLTDKLQWQGSATWQRARLDKYNLYDAAETLDQSDDRILDFSGGVVPHNPDFMFRTGVVYSSDNWYGGINYQWVGKRYGNFQNAFVLPGYGIVGADVSYALTQKMSLGLRARNLLNSTGLANFFGPNEFGSSANQASAEFIAANPSGSFTVFPIMPRAIYFSLDYQF